MAGLVSSCLMCIAQEHVVCSVSCVPLLQNFFRPAAELDFLVTAKVKADHEIITFSQLSPIGHINMSTHNIIWVEDSLSS